MSDTQSTVPPIGAAACRFASLASCLFCRSRGSLYWPRGGGGGGGEGRSVGGGGACRATPQPMPTSFCEFFTEGVRARRTLGGGKGDAALPTKRHGKRAQPPFAAFRRADATYRHQSASALNSRFRPRRTSFVESWLVWLPSAAYSLLAVHMHGLRCRSSCSPLHLVPAQRLRAHLYRLRRLSGQGKRTTRVKRRPA